MNHEKLNKRDIVRSRGFEPVREKKKEDFKRMISLFSSDCFSCKKKILKGTKIRYYFEFKKAIHANCKTPKEFR